MSSRKGPSKQIIIHGKWELGSKLGSGAFGTIYLGRDMKTGEEVAIKLESARRKVSARVCEDGNDDGSAVSTARARVCASCLLLSAPFGLQSRPPSYSPLSGLALAPVPTHP